MQEESSDNKELRAKIISCLKLLQKLDNLYENADLKAKKAIVSSTFPEKLYFDGKKCRTPRINEVLLRALNADKSFRKTKSGLTPQNLVLSALVESTWIFRSQLCHPFRSECATDFGVNYAKKEA